MSYKLTTNGVIDLSSGAFIPANPDNDDYKIYLAWEAAGNVPAPADAPPAWSPTPTLKAFRDAREVVLNRLMGVAYSAGLAGDTATVNACETAKQGLLGIPQLASVTGATDEASLETALANGYNAVLAAVPVNVIKAFAADYNSFTVLGK